jgi:sialic acid synthase SpsE
MSNKLLGASVVEKHFTLARADGRVDSSFSLEPHELKTLVLESKRAWQALGCVAYGPTVSETRSLGFRHSIYVAEDIQVGDICSG